MSVYRLTAAYERQSPRRRMAGLALALCANLLLMLVLLSLNGKQPRPGEGLKPLVVSLLPSDKQSDHPQKQVTKPRAVPTPRAIPKPPIVLPIKPPIVTPPTTVIPMSKDELDSADLRNIASNSDGGGSAGDSQVVGTAPNGDVMYAAEWARHPTNAELGGYLPATAPDGYGTVACKTMPEDRVDDCVEIDQSPLGSGLARAVRLAAWQFRVRPPRKNGKPLVGSYVMIRIYYEGRSTGGSGSDSGD